jgi:hypothetical protein
MDVVDGSDRSLAVGASAAGGFTVLGIIGHGKFKFAIVGTGFVYSRDVCNIS